jgi:DNA-binding response OmpR family regulator
MELQLKSVLIIEDDEDICFLLKQTLSARNYHIFLAHSLNETRELLGSVCPAFIFIDHCLPDGLGLDFVPVLRENYPESKIIAMTAQETAENKIHAFRKGVDFFLEKPFLLNQIYGLLDLVPKSG